MSINIYIYQSIRGPGKKNGAYTYILETEFKGKPLTLTKIGTLEEMSENKAELVTLLKALKRLRKECDLNIFTSSNHIKTGIEEWLDKWANASWKNAKGKEIANIEEWQRIKAYKDKYTIKVIAEKNHSFRNWMIAETEKKLNEK